MTVGRLDAPSDVVFSAVLPLLLIGTLLFRIHGEEINGYSFVVPDRGKCQRAGHAGGRPAQRASSVGIEVPAVPANLEVPAGNEVYLHGRAVGTQNYMCILTKKGMRWQFLGPQATLFIPVAGELQQQITTHFLSPNPAESGLPRATWQSSLDTSQVWARAIATSTDANYVAPNSIPWLLLQSVGSAAGPTGGDS